MNEYKKEYLKEIAEKLNELSKLFAGLANEYIDEHYEEEEYDD